MGLRLTRWRRKRGRRGTPAGSDHFKKLYYVKSGGGGGTGRVRPRIMLGPINPKCAYGILRKRDGDGFMMAGAGKRGLKVDGEKTCRRGGESWNREAIYLKTASSVESRERKKAIVRRISDIRGGKGEKSREGTDLPSTQKNGEGRKSRGHKGDTSLGKKRNLVFAWQGRVVHTEKRGESGEDAKVSD